MWKINAGRYAKGRGNMSKNSFILNAEGFHDRAIAQKWLDHFAFQWQLLPDCRNKEKIKSIMLSCETEDQLTHFYFCVKNYVEMLLEYGGVNQTMIIKHTTHRVVRSSEPTFWERVKHFYLNN